jgi:serine/threonine protein phosphatase PrpC
MMAVLADGMGGLSGGALAAEQVIRTARQAFDLFSPQTDSIEAMLENIVQEAHTVIKLTAISTEKKPHSTVVVLVITPERRAVWAHVGDSRLYRFDGPNCADRTVDHSYVENLVSKGRLSREQAQHHQLANVLVNALGMSEAMPAATIGRHDMLKSGDAFLLCSDGLWHYFQEGELGAAIAMNAPRRAAEMLIARARERAAGTAADNCTLAVVKLVKVEQEKSPYTVDRMRRAT